MVSLGIQDLDIMGGEPFLLPWMPSFLHAAIKDGIMVNISTNGSFPEVMKELRGLSSGKINIGISLEGSTAEAHNCLTSSANFDKAVASIASLVSRKLDPIVKSVVHRQTMADMQDIISFLKQMGVQRCYLIHMDQITWGINDQMSAISYPAFLNFFQKIKMTNPGIEINKVNASCFERQTLPEGMRCAGSVRKLSVMPDGTVYPCSLFQHAPEFRLGNLFTDPFSTLWENPKLAFFRNFSTNKCPRTDCSNHSSCTGGCPAHALFHGYDMQDMDIRCRKHQSHRRS